MDGIVQFEPESAGGADDSSDLRRDALDAVENVAFPGATSKDEPRLQ